MFWKNTNFIVIYLNIHKIFYFKVAFNAIFIKIIHMKKKKS